MKVLPDFSSPRRKNSVRIIAPGMAFDKNELDLSVTLLKSWGFDLEIPKGLLGTHPVSAHTELERWRHLQLAFESDVRIIWAARGGYGSLHLLKYLQKMKKPQHKKLLIGFSDITTLHQFVNDQWGWNSLHGPHVDRLYKLSEQRQKEIHQIICGKKSKVEFTLKPLNRAANENEALTAKVVGGNLITTQSTFGTPWQLRTKNRILFLEDIGERGYRVDRVLEHMWNLKLLQFTKAIIFGPFVGGEEPGGGRSKVFDVIRYFSEKLKVPVFKGIDSGHIVDSKVLPFFTKAIIKGHKIIIDTEITE